MPSAAQASTKLGPDDASTTPAPNVFTAGTVGGSDSTSARNTSRSGRSGRADASDCASAAAAGHGSGAVAAALWAAVMRAIIVATVAQAWLSSVAWGGWVGAGDEADGVGEGELPACGAATSEPPAEHPVRASPASMATEIQRLCICPYCRVKPLPAADAETYSRRMATDDPTFDEKRHEQLTRAPKSSEEDAAPRITTSTTEGGATRIDVADTAVVRPGNPEKQNGDD